jgi:hypothetical protein
MGRLHHIERTLIPNLITISKYKYAEIILLNYNSRDGMHKWITSNCKSWINNGKLKYFYTNKPKHFFAPHAKNIAYLQSKSDFICNLDADNYVVDNLCFNLVEIFRFKENTIICSHPNDFSGNHGAAGKLAAKKEIFMSVNGYDEEQISGWGFDDFSLQKRMQLINDNPICVLEQKYNRVIPHSNEERSKNFLIKDISLSRQKSIDRLNSQISNKNYIVNQNKNWGYISDLKCINIL